MASGSCSRTSASGEALSSGHRANGALAVAADDSQNVHGAEFHRRRRLDLSETAKAIHENWNDYRQPARRRFRLDAGGRGRASRWTCSSSAAATGRRRRTSKLDPLLESAVARRDFRARLADHGIGISALNCSGSPVHPGEAGRRHDAVTRKTIQLAGLLDVDRVVMMSDVPARPATLTRTGSPTEWPPEVREILRWQWDEVLIPYWRDLVAYSKSQGVDRLCLELHGHQNVYNVATLQRLREAVGETIGANLDPSHLMWMGADPLAAARALNGAIYYVHAKDTRIDPAIAGVNGVIDTTPGALTSRAPGTTSRSGYGHDEAWWRAFVAALTAAGYDGVLSIEHEDPAMSAVRASRNRLRRCVACWIPLAPRFRRGVARPMHATPSRRRVVVFDLGGVLVDWDPRNLYRKIFRGDENAMEAFLAEVCTVEWNERQDAAGRFAEAAAELMPRHVDKIDLIDAFSQRFDEMITGPIAEAVDILADLKRAGVPRYALTNWSAETFPPLRDRFPFPFVVRRNRRVRARKV